MLFHLDRGPSGNGSTAAVPTDSCLAIATTAAEGTPDPGPSTPEDPRAPAFSTRLGRAAFAVALPLSVLRPLSETKPENRTRLTSRSRCASVNCRRGCADITAAAGGCGGASRPSARSDACDQKLRLPSDAANAHPGDHNWPTITVTPDRPQCARSPPSLRPSICDSKRCATRSCRSRQSDRQVPQCYCSASRPPILTRDRGRAFEPRWAGLRGRPSTSNVDA